MRARDMERQRSGGGRTAAAAGQQAAWQGGRRKAAVPGDLGIRTRDVADQGLGHLAEQSRISVRDQYAPARAGQSGGYREGENR
jgi:hypothetical protein